MKLEFDGNEKKKRKVKYLDEIFYISLLNLDGLIIKLLRKSIFVLFEYFMCKMYENYIWYFWL